MTWDFDGEFWTSADGLLTVWETDGGWWTQIQNSAGGWYITQVDAGCAVEAQEAAHRLAQKAAVQ